MPDTFLHPIMASLIVKKTTAHLNLGGGFFIA